ncbi:MAG: CAP domain-containing protein [Bacteroidetes bacterium]|nr:CAP domain-containing protein [Bacteroidota bacterium]
MKTSAKLLVLFITVIALTSCSKEDDIFNSPVVSTELVTFNNSLENEVLTLVNIHREGLGLSKVAALAPAYSEAINHTKYMIDQNKISHDNFEVRSRNLMTSAKAKVVLENVAAGYTTAEGVVNGWLNSELHRKNIEDSSVQFMSVSVQQNASGRNYYTQIFVGK